MVQPYLHRQAPNFRPCNASLIGPDIVEKKRGVRQDDRMNGIIFKILLTPSDIPLCCLHPLRSVPHDSGRLRCHSDFGFTGVRRFDTIIATGFLG